MTILSFISIINTYSFILIGVYVLKLNAMETMNRITAGVYFSFAVWSFCYTFLYIAPTAEAAMLWHRLGAIGWGMFCPLGAHFFIALSDKTKRKQGIKRWIMIYTLPILIIINALANPSGTSVAKGFTPGMNGAGWAYISNIRSGWYWIYLVHIIVYFALALSRMYRWAVDSKRQRFLKQAKSIIVLNTIVLIVGGFWDLGLPATGLLLPPACNFVAILWGIGFLYIIKELKLMSADDAATPDLILKTVQDPILVLNSEGLIIKCNQATEEMFKLNQEQLINKPLAGYLKARGTGLKIVEQLSNGAVAHNLEVEFVDSEGRTIITRASFSLAESKLDGLIGVVANLHDITALKEVENELNKRNEKYVELSRQLEVLANYDALTGLPNRRILIDKVDLAISEFEATGKAFALIFIDLDGFKSINDMYGHDVGDKLLQRVSEIFKAIIRKTDFVTRVGGDEFILFIDMKEDFNLEGLTGRLKGSFAEPLIIEGNICDVDISIGVSKCPEDGVTRDELIKVSDNRMYTEKNKRKFLREKRSGGV
ncbi:MAG: diguanylate cyclase [Clostridiales bacterium]|nr:diguanylate cyclase [Clostridiales bacterium]